MKPTKPNRLLLLLGSLCICHAGTSSAAPIVWDGSTDGVFGTATNWSTDVAPANNLTSDIATFSGTPTANQPTVTADYSVNGIDFTSGGWTLGSGGNFNLNFGTGNLSSIGNNTIAANISANNAGAHTVSSSAGSTLTINQFTGSNGTNVIFGTATNTGTVVLQGTTDNNFLSGTIAFGTVIVNKGTVGGTTSSGSAFNNVTVNSGATLKYGTNSTDRDPVNLYSQGQIYGGVTLNGTFDLNGNGTVSDNYSISNLTGNTGVVTNNGTGTGQLRISNGGTEYSYGGTITDGTAPTRVLINVGANQAFNGTSNTYTGGTEITKGTLRVKEDGSLGAVPLSASTNLTMNGATAMLQNSDSVVTLNANRLVSIGVNGGGFKAGWNKDVTINGVISGSGPVKIYGDSGTVVYNGVNTYTGNTILDVSSSKLSISDDAAMLFVLGANGVNNKITGNIANQGTITINGDFTFDLALAALADGNVWSIVDVNNVNETFGSTFTVKDFTETSTTTWNLVQGGNSWTFSESTGQLTLALIPEPSVSLLGGLGALALLRRRRLA